MVSIVSICNLALSNIGKDNISSLTEASAEARACNQFYEHARDTLLQVYPWRFAGVTQSLASVTNDKVGEWSHAYALPSDYLKARWIRPEYSDTDAVTLTQQQEIQIPYDIEGDKLYCNMSPAFLRYTRRITDPTKFTPLFVDALSWALTVRLAMPLTRDLKQRNDAYKLAQMARAEAEMADANEVRNSADHDSELVEVRS